MHAYRCGCAWRRRHPELIPRAAACWTTAWTGSLGGRHEQDRQGDRQFRRKTHSEQLAQPPVDSASNYLRPLVSKGRRLDELVDRELHLRRSRRTLGRRWRPAPARCRLHRGTATPACLGQLRSDRRHARRVRVRFGAQRARLLEHSRHQLGLRLDVRRVRPLEDLRLVEGLAVDRAPQLSCPQPVVHLGSRVDLKPQLVHRDLPLLPEATDPAQHVYEAAEPQRAKQLRTVLRRPARPPDALDDGHHAPVIQRHPNLRLGLARLGRVKANHNAHDVHVADRVVVQPAHVALGGPRQPSQVHCQNFHAASPHRVATPELDGRPPRLGSDERHRHASLCRGHKNHAHDAAAKTTRKLGAAKWRLKIINASGRLQRTRRPLTWRRVSHSGPQASLTACLTFARRLRLSSACQRRRRRYSLASAVGATPQISVLSWQW
eukprot:scaffold9645_cov76-Phaeocystis_antarctica.AAC.2